MTGSASYRRAAEETARWLEHVAVPGRDGGLTWPTAPGYSDQEVTSLGWGGLGPILFFADAFRTTRDPHHLDIAKRGATDMCASIDQQEAPGLFTGLGGFVPILRALHGSTSGYNEEIDRTCQTLASMATMDGDTAHWFEITEVLWGTAGIGCVLLDARDHTSLDAVDLASKAGNWLLSVAEPRGGGLCWSLGESVVRERPETELVRFPNFAHGTAGIAAFLTKLARVTGESRYLDAALAGARWIFTTCKTVGDICIAWHHEPGSVAGYRPTFGPERDPDDRSPLYSFGWCHGPPGLAWFFRELEVATGDKDWATWIERAARSVRLSGIPEHSEPGFWDNFGRCCGSASAIEFFLDLHTWRQDPDDLSFAMTVADDLLARATTDDDGTRWSNIEFRADPPTLPAQTTFLQGASGIGMTLLRLARHLEGDRSVLRLPHEPDWSPGPGT